MRKIIIIIIVAVFAMAMIALSLFPYFIPTGTYERWIEEELTSGLNARVSIEKFQLRFIPSPGYTINGLVLLSTEVPFKGQKVLYAERVDGTLSLFKFLGGKIDTSIKVHGLEVDYRSTDGVSNVDQMFGWESRGVGDVYQTTERLQVEEPQAPPADVEGIKSIPAIAPPDLPSDELNKIDKTDTVDETDKPKTEEIPIKALPAPPSSHLFDDMLIRSAHAGSSSSGDGYSINVRSIDIVGGKLNIYPEDGGLPQVVDRIDLAGRNIGIQGKGAERILSANIRMNGATLGSPSPNLSVNGKFIYDTQRKELSARGLTVYLTGAQMMVDLTVNVAVSPKSYDIHLASPSVIPTVLASFYPDSLKRALADLSWQGTLAIDLSMRGTSNEYELGVQMDATQASIKFGRIFSKGASLPLKILATTFVRPKDFVIRKAQMIIGEDKILLKGDVMRDDLLNANLTVSGEGLDESLLKVFFQKFVLIDSFESLAVSIDMEGPLAVQDSIMSLSGGFSAKRADIAGFSIKDLEGSFTRALQEISIPVFKGIFAGGDLSGNGSVSINDKTVYRFDGVVERMDADQLTLLGGSMRGKSSLIVHVLTEGSDPLSLSKNLNLNGSLIIPSGAFTDDKIGKRIFTNSMWRGLEAVADTTFDKEQKKKLGNVSSEFSDFNAYYEIDGKTLKVKSISWNNSMYVIEAMESEIILPDTKGFGVTRELIERSFKNLSISAEGKLILPKGVAMPLVTDKNARAKILDEKGRLVLPIKIGGTLKSPTFSVDHVKFDKLIELPEKREKISEEEKKKRSEAAKPAAKRPIKKSAPKKTGTKRRRPKQEKRDPEDVLKVIIGR